MSAGEFDVRVQWLLDGVGHELTRALKKFDSFNSPHEGWAVIYEEFVKELGDHVWANTGQSVDAHDEAMQTAAMALRYIYDLCEWGPTA